MESQPQNPEVRINPENFHPCMAFYALTFCWAQKGNQVSLLEERSDFWSKSITTVTC